MQQPLDYATNTDEPAANTAEPNITYAALLDRFESEQLITNEMIQQACQQMEAAQQFPFAPVDQAGSAWLQRLLRSMVGARNQGLASK